MGVAFGDDNSRAHPTSNGGMEKWKLSRNLHALRTRFFFARFAPTCMLSRRLATKKISASELRRKFIKSALSVGQERGKTHTHTQMWACATHDPELGGEKAKQEEVGEKPSVKK